MFFGMRISAQSLPAANQDPIPQNLEEIKKRIHLPPYYYFNGINLKVICHVLINEVGIPQEWVIVGRTDFLLGYLFNQQIKDLRFNPAIVNGVAIKAWVLNPVYFTGPELFDSIEIRKSEPGERDYGFDKIYRVEKEKEEMLSFPDGILRFNNLQVISLNGNDIPTVPDAICELKDLRILNLQGNRISQLPACISEMTKLEYLFLGDNSLKIDRQDLQKKLPDTHIVWEKAFDNPDK